MTNKALIIVDVQNDFVEGGSLGVNGGNAAARGISEFLKENVDKFDLVLATRDWHISPGDHFDTWPEHCVAETEGAELQAELKQTLEEVAPSYQMISKGMFNDGYSGFEGSNLETSHPIIVVLGDNAISELVIVGIATDYCVRATALDAARLYTRFDISVLTDLIAGVAEDTSEKALEEMASKGIKLTTSTEWANSND